MTPAGDVAAIDDSSGTLSACTRNTSRAFQYDFLDRLVASPGWLAYGYDANGNRTSEAVEGAAASYTHDTGTDRVATELVPGGSGQVGKYWMDGYDYQSNQTVIAK